MTYFTDTNTATATQPSRIAALLATVALKMRQRKVYNKTYSELCTMTDRDLADLGMCRSDFHRIANEAADQLT